MIKTVSHNVRNMTIASVGQKICAFVYFTILARYLGPEDVGKYVFTLSFAAIFVILIDLGLTSVLIREGARHKERLQKYISTIVYVKVPLGVLAYILMLCSVVFLGYSRQVVAMVGVAGITMFFDSLHMTFFGALRAHGDLRYEAYGMVGSQLVTVILGLLCVWFKLPLIYLVGVFTISSFLNVLFALVVVQRILHLSFVPRFDKATFVQVKKIAIPFAVAACAARVYSYIDSIILSKLAGDIAVGIYAIPYKITFAFQFIPLALIASLYPMFSKLFQENKEALAEHFAHAVQYLAIIVFPLAFGLGVLAEEVIVGLYTMQYYDSIIPLRILLVSLIFSFLGFPVGALLNACNRQATQTRIVLWVMVVNIVLNLVFITHFGAIAAASAALIGNVLLTCVGYGVVRHIITIKQKIFFMMLGKIMLVAGVMGVVVWCMHEPSTQLASAVFGGYWGDSLVVGVAMLLRIVFGGILYVLGLMSLRVITKKEWQLALRTIRGKGI